MPGASSASALRFAARQAAVRGCRCSARPSTSTPRSSTTRRARRSRPPRRWRRTCATPGKTGADIDAAKAVGKLLAERAAQKGVKEVVFDRGAYIYHGRVKALADAAREGGLSF
ncbi:hypothetical protein ACVWY2_002057 [Bradyrhizobium sp. JR6.1]